MLRFCLMLLGWFTADLLFWWVGVSKRKRGELIVAAAHAGLGHLLDPRSGASVPTLFAALAVIVVIGVAVDYLVFGQLDRRIRRRRGLLVET